MKLNISPNDIAKKTLVVIGPRRSSRPTVTNDRRPFGMRTNDLVVAGEKRPMSTNDNRCFFAISYGLIRPFRTREYVRAISFQRLEVHGIGRNGSRRINFIGQSVNLVPGRDRVNPVSSLRLAAVQSGASRHSQGFEDKNLCSSPGLLGQ